MGLDYTAFEAIFRSLKYVTNKRKLLTIGRQGIHIPSSYIDSFLEKNNLSDLKDRYHWGFCEKFFIDLGFESVDSLDYSSYENASIIHNMNTPIPSDSSTYDYILDCGSTEHMFNIPQVCENIINLLNIGGIYVSITPNNNLSGHGIYQFSPEFYLTAFSTKYGMEVQELHLAKAGFAYNSWINVNNFNENENGRNMSTFDCKSHVLVIAIIKKISNDRLSLITHSPNQYSYENIDWKK